ncbi:MAG: hypothetical protein OXR03_13205, partial [Rhodospirillaceae bacterium]|nr:hypothetical protein [Rhodospirillaceae bacterium]
GNDTLIGRGGDDIYVMRSGDGQDVIDNVSGASVGDRDTIRYAPEFDVTALKVTQNGSGLLLDMGGGDSALLQNWFGSNQTLARQVNVEFAGTGALALRTQDSGPGTATGELIAATVAGATLSGNGGNDVLIAFDTSAGATGSTLLGGADSDLLLGKGGVDTLNGGLGDDTLSGGGSDDLFIVSAGEGRDRITDFAAGAGSEDVIDLQSHDSLFNLDAVLTRATDDGVDTTIALSSDDFLTLDGVLVSDLHADDFIFAELPIRAPVVTANEDVSVASGEFIALSDLFTITDPGDTVARYFFTDHTKTADSGYIAYADGTPVGNTIEFSSIDGMRFYGGVAGVVDDIQIQVQDSQGAWSGYPHNFITTTVGVNRAPVATANEDVSVASGEFIALSDLFTITDPGDTVARYFFTDHTKTADSGYIAYADGTPVGNTIEFSSIDGMRFYGGVAGVVDDIQIQVQDSQGAWSGYPHNFITSTAGVNVAPVATANEDVSVASGEFIALSDLFTVSDPGDEIARYFFTDHTKTADSGYIAYADGTPVGNTIEFSSIDGMRFYGGVAGAVDDIQIQVQDSQGAWNGYPHNFITTTAGVNAELQAANNDATSPDSDPVDAGNESTSGTGLVEDDKLFDFSAESTEPDAEGAGDYFIDVGTENTAETSEVIVSAGVAFEPVLPESSLIQPQDDLFAF